MLLVAVTIFVNFGIGVSKAFVGFAPIGDYGALLISSPSSLIYDIFASLTTRAELDLSTRLEFSTELMVA